MAVYLKVEWYDSAADLETKRRIIKTAIEIQRYAGTVKAVREQVSVTYPDSEVEEWFDYGGTPGFWRLNVNITDAPAQYHTIDEMEDLLGYTKRLTAHLEYISYMVRHGISVGAQVECMAYKVPICGATICGTYWRLSTLGWSSNGLLNVGGQAEAFLDSPKITGTIPRISTKGWSGGQTLDATPQIKDGLLAILHDRLYQACTHYIEIGHIDLPGLKNVEYLYKSYHALGGNGTGTELYTRAKALPIRED